MKKIFGSRVVMAEQRDNQRAPMMHHGRRGRGNRGVGQHHRSIRSTHSLIAPKPTWPNPGKTGLTMKFLDSDKSGNQYFTFDHNSAYQAVQRQFFDAVESMNPDFIVVSLSATQSTHPLTLIMVSLFFSNFSNCWTSTPSTSIPCCSSATFAKWERIARWPQNWLSEPCSWWRHHSTPCSASRLARLGWIIEDKKIGTNILLRSPLHQFRDAET